MSKWTAECGARHARHYVGAICLGIALTSLGAVGCGHKGSDRDAASPSDTTGSSTMSTGGTTSSGSGDMSTGGTTSSDTGTGTGGTGTGGTSGSMSQ